MKNNKDWEVLLRRANACDNMAQYDVATGFDYGLTVDNTKIVSEDKSKAFEWYNSAYKNGNMDAVIRVADFLSEGIYCKQDIERAIELYQKGIDNGSGIAANNLGTIFRDKQDYKTAFELYQSSQNLDKSNSLKLALCHYWGIGTVKDLKKAYDILVKISQGSPDTNNSQYEIDEANYLLGRIYLDGEVVEKSIEKARYFLELADTDNDHRSAQELLIVIGRNIRGAL